MKNFLVIFAILGGFLGFLVAGVFFWNGTGNKIMFATVGIAIGACLGCFIGSLMVTWKKEGFVLIRKIQKLNPIRGKHINDVVQALGGYTSKVPTRITDRNNEMGETYRFVDGKYEVEILVGADGICIGVLKEVLHGKKLH